MSRLSPLIPQGLCQRESPLPLSEVGEYPLAGGRNPEDPPLGDAPGPRVPDGVGLGLEVGGWGYYPFGECLPDIEPELVG